MRQLSRSPLLQIGRNGDLASLGFFLRKKSWTERTEACPGRFSSSIVRAVADAVSDVGVQMHAGSRARPILTQDSGAWHRGKTLCQGILRLTAACARGRTQNPRSSACMLRSLKERIFQLTNVRVNCRARKSFGSKGLTLAGPAQNLSEALRLVSEAMPGLGLRRASQQPLLQWRGKTTGSGEQRGGGGSRATGTEALLPRIGSTRRSRTSPGGRGDDPLPAWWRFRITLGCGLLVLGSDRLR